ncbi:MAG: FAD-dependent oxidoreductase, partial [Candidatus Obscuribacterales bacterium]|nr:FAD-dependent oxidoreductase [Candidatus Obscuribacterales bacterium]
GTQREISFEKCLSGYDKSFIGLLQNTSKSFFCAGIETVSAKAGYFMVKALTTDSYVFDGGNSGIAKALRKAIDARSPGSIKTQCFVWTVTKRDGGASVVYSDASGDLHRVDCKHVVVTTPPFVAARIVSQLPESLLSLWLQIEYGAFVVTNFCMPKKVLQYPYLSYADEPYPFCQMIMAEAPYQLSGRYKPEMGSVLSVYHPYEFGPVGRSKVLMLNRDDFASNMVADLSRLFEPLQNNLEQIEITRWGHAIIVPKPGLSEVLNKANQVTTDWMTFAHSSASGGQSLSGALGAARNAASRCLEIVGAEH